MKYLISLFPPALQGEPMSDWWAALDPWDCSGFLAEPRGRPKTFKYHNKYSDLRANQVPE